MIHQTYLYIIIHHRLHTHSLQEMIFDYTNTLKRIPPVLLPMMRPYVDRVDAAIKPGLVSLSWSSLTVHNC